MMNCFKSLSPTAVNATVLYDFHDDDHHFWSRSNLTVPLPPCVSSSFSAPPPNSNCLVCHGKKMVFAICRNLTKGVKLTMEAGSDWVNLTATDCPKPPSDGGDDDQKLRRANNQSPSRTGPPEGDLLTSCFRLQT
ncbi:uncharacterized protein LOC117250933 isoform X4 [Epinephelus lanceolatus]